jgi:type IV secretory pathway VirB4 component
MDNFTKKYLQVKDLEEDIDLFSRLSNLAVIGKDFTRNTLISLSLIRYLRTKGMIVTVIEIDNNGDYYRQLCLELGGEYQNFTDGLSQSENPLLVMNIDKPIGIDFEKDMDSCSICNILRERVDLGISTEKFRGYIVIDRILPPTGKF